jgi:hypothetical protein
MSTSTGYAYEKFYSGVIALAADSNPERDLRARLKAAFASAIMHAHPPYGDSMPPRAAERIDELFAAVRRGPKLDDDEAIIAATLDLMSDEELEAVAADIVAIFGLLAATQRS